ncbi:tryptophan 2,3-dioxygenase family protein [Streptomyces sp. NPDC102406]|uniref:tryptophan 2,3-dioxygenase family protein n=1 Tax=Streptomyces sp. NPDC102406 TaxID=3366171 RepID=UPI0037F6BA9B
METPYACYLRLPDLLKLQHPRTPPGEAGQWADERFFITVHQSAEVLAGQALADLARASQQESCHQHATAATALRRVTAVMDILEAHLALLEHLRPESFAAFRPLLDNASGAQSSQFRELFEQIAAAADWLPEPPQDADGTARSEAAHRYAKPQDPWERSQELQALRAAVTRWRTRHLLLVERMIGDQGGTGGSSGLAYLRSRIDLPPRA